MKIYAHRGASGYAPENTMEAFKKALEFDIDGIETDIHLTKDNVLVLIHDETVNRTTNGVGRVKDMTYNQLLELDASNGMEGYANCKIPTLRELFDLVKDSDVCLQLEIKTDVHFYDGIEKAVLDLVKEYGYQKRVCYSSFNHLTLQKLTSLNVKNRLGFLYEGVMIEPWNYVIKHKGIAVHPPKTCLKIKDFVKNCHMQNLKVNIWTINKPEMMQQCLDLKVDGIFTNYPDVAINIKQR